MTKTAQFILKEFTGTGLTGIAYKDQIRKKQIISQMSTREEITINDISDILNISVPKATELIVELLEAGLVKESGKRSDGPGRKASYYALRSDSFYFLGVEIKKYKINIGLMGFDKVMVYHRNDIPFFYQD